MKSANLIILLLFVIGSKTTNGQIVLDHVIDASTFGGEPYIGQSFYTAQLSANETKYVFCDNSTNTFSLYNMDLSPFITNIALPAPLQNGLLQPIYITRSLFDCDSTTIEYAYEAPIEGLGFWIMRTDGTQLFHQDSVNAPYCIGGCLGLSDMIVPIRNTSDGTKLFLQKQNPNTATSQFYIYSLCGTLETDGLFEHSEQASYITGVFPNPSQQEVNFRLQLPDNINQYQLVITSGNASEVKRQFITTGNGLQTLNVSDLSNGIYFYSLCTDSKVYQTGKFIVTH